MFRAVNTSGNFMSKNKAAVKEIFAWRMGTGKHIFMFCRKNERKSSVFLPKRAEQIDKKAK